MIPNDLHILEGAPADYLALAHLHYRAARPATICRVLVARIRSEKLAALVVSCPVLNARWRERLWPSDPAPADPRDRAAHLNATLRCISRVVVDPRARGLGIGTALVRAYLRHPLTTRTEAVAAMGAVCGFFAAAGMREVILPPTQRDRTLRAVLRTARIAPWELLDPARITRRRARALEPALRRWANDARGSRAAAHAPVDELVERAARAIASPLPSRAYGHDAPDTPET